MPGSSTAIARWPPPPLRLAARLLLAAVLVLAPLQALERFIVEPLVPVFQAVVGVLDTRFVITDARVAREGPHEVVSFRANLRQPVTIAGSVVYPFGSHGVPVGGYQTSRALSGMLQYSALLLIIVLTWPARSASEIATRLLTSLFLVGLLLLVDLPTTVVAELEHLLEMQVDPRALSPWMIWSRFLMGGGGIALSILLAVAAIRIGRRYSGPPAGENDPPA